MLKKNRSNSRPDFLISKLKGLKSNRSGLSEVVTTVFLILISVLAVVLVASIITKSIRKNLDEGTSCFDLRDYAKIVDNEYSCSNSSYSRIMIERGSDNHTIKGFYVSVLLGGNSKGYNILEPSIPGVEMINRTLSISSVIELPQPGEARTYIFRESPNGEKISLGVINEKNKVCDVETYDLPLCI